MYADDDGEDFPICTESDLTEAIIYFDDTEQLSSSSSPHHKVTIRVDVVVEYDGPSLSDTSSISSFRSGDGEETNEGSVGRSSGYEESYRSYGRNGLGDEVIDEAEEGRTELSDRSVSTTGTSRQNGSVPYEWKIHTNSHSSTVPSRRRPSTLHPAQARPLTGPDSDPAPELLTYSELGSRWLWEQSRLTFRRYGPDIESSRNEDRHDEDGESSEGETPGDLALIRDARGSTFISTDLG